MSNPKVRVEADPRVAGFGALLTLLFIGLKLSGIISWSWWWVLAPLWIPWAVFLLILLVVFVVIVVGWK